METLTLRPSQLAAALAELSDLRIPACVWGPPGIGKSEIIQQSAASTGRKLKEFRAALSEPTDLKGFGKIRTENGTDYTDYAVPYELPKPTDGKGLLFADEVNRAPMATQNTLMQLVLRPFRLGNYQLPDDWCIHAACNREGDGGGVQRMPGAFAERFVHLYLEPDLDDTCKWGLTVNASGQCNLEALVIAFLRFRPSMLCEYDKTERSNPNPRAWHFVSDIVRSNPNRDHAITKALIAGKVGHKAAIEFSAFMSLWKKLPNIDAILLNPDKAQLPTDPGVKFAVASALSRKATPNNFGSCLKYMGRLPEQEFTVMFAKDAVQRDPSICNTPEFTAWAINNPLN